MFAYRNGRARYRQRGQGLVEYALILVLVAVVVIIIVGVLGQQIQEVFCDALLGLGDNAPSVEACAAPRVRCGISNGATVANPVWMEIFVTDDKGLQGNITVQTFLDGASPHTEYNYMYCWPDGDGPCSTRHLSLGTHTIRAIATDADGNTGECSTTFTVN